jgi:hypothetical protein
LKKLIATGPPPPVAAVVGPPPLPDLRHRPPPKPAAADRRTQPREPETATDVLELDPVGEKKKILFFFSFSDRMLKEFHR